MDMRFELTDGYTNELDFFAYYIKVWEHVVA
jgi:hypothetical protein